MLAALSPVSLAGGVGETYSSFGTPKTVEEYVIDYFSDIPVMGKVAYCESRFRQFNESGDILRGEENNLDVGVMQINEHYHLDTAQKLGLDIYTLNGNLTYARHLFEQEGTTPWLSSSSCWGRENHIAIH